MSNDAENLAPAPELPQSDAPQQRTSHGHFARGNTVGRQFGRGNSLQLKHGLRSRAHGKLDRRRAVDRAVTEALAAWEKALGDRLTPQRAMLLANVGRRLRDLAKIEDFEATLPSFADQKRRRPWPITEAKWKLLEAIDKALERIGLERYEGKATSLGDVIARYAPADEPEPSGQAEP